MSRQDEIAAKAVRKSTLKSIKYKKRARIKQLKEDYEKELREVEIEYAENPERLKAKFAAEAKLYIPIATLKAAIKSTTKSCNNLGNEANIFFTFEC